jgi:hypothetical protein
MQQKFKAKLTAIGPKGAWTILPIPFNVAEVFGTKARVPVAGTMNGFAFRNSLMPEGNGTHRMMVGKELQAGAKARAGEVVSVVLKRDDEKRIVETPAELAAALKKNKQAAAFFTALSPVGSRPQSRLKPGPAAPRKPSRCSPPARSVSASLDASYSRLE